MENYKKTIKQEYKNRPPDAGVFQIKNLQNGKIFVRSHMNLHAALNRFPMELKLGVSRISQLQADYNQLGAGQFVFEILERLEPQDDPNYNYADDLQTLEEVWLEKLQPYGEKGYNKQK